MSQHASAKSALTIALLVAALALTIAARSRSQPVAQTDAAKSRAAFLAALPVFRHPRCLNCHSNGDFPRQGDDGHPHAQNVKRGVDGKGKYAEKCSACHQEHNTPGANMPPGAPSWHLPPAATPMIWEGKTPHEICDQLKDPKRNGGKTIGQIVEHVTSDKLVMWGWDPGEGRSPPPISHEEFARRMEEWARYGAVSPE